MVLGGLKRETRWWARWFWMVLDGCYHLLLHFRTFCLSVKMVHPCVRQIRRIKCVILKLQHNHDNNNNNLRFKVEKAFKLNSWRNISKENGQKHVISYSSSDLNGSLQDFTIIWKSSCCVYACEMLLAVTKQFPAQSVSALNALSCCCT